VINMLQGYALGIVALFLGAVLAVAGYLGANALMHFTLGYELPWFSAVWAQTASILTSYVATLLAFNFITDKRAIWGWPLIATAFASLVSWSMLSVAFSDDTLSVLFVTTVFSITGSVYQNQLNERLASVARA